MSDIKAINTNGRKEFEEKANELLSNGYRFDSSYCGFVQSEKYDFCESWQGVFIKDINDMEIKPSSVISVPDYPSLRDEVAMRVFVNLVAANVKPESAAEQGFTAADAFLKARG